MGWPGDMGMIRALALLGILHTNEHTAHAASIECHVVLRSALGGTVEVKSGVDAPGFSEKALLIGWHPASTDSRIDLTLSYRRNNLQKIEPVAGGNISAGINPGMRSGTLEFKFGSGRGAGTLKADAKNFIDGVDQSSQRAIATFTRHSSKVEEQNFISEVDRGGSLTVVLSQGDNDLVKSTFRVGATRARDSLIKVASAKIEALDPTVCRRPDNRPFVLPSVNR